MIQFKCILKAYTILFRGFDRISGLRAYLQLFGRAEADLGLGAYTRLSISYLVHTDSVLKRLHESYDGLLPHRASCLLAKPPLGAYHDTSDLRPFIATSVHPSLNLLISLMLVDFFIYNMVE